ncbi:MAG: DEAD/DEAH box helicase [Planctomycetes bacterium]|nr:DEAD/DEAH box helicase [Planctomycetota bacterium]
MIRVELVRNRLEIRADASQLRPRDNNQLAFWGFVATDTGSWVFSALEGGAENELMPKLVAYFKRRQLPFMLSPELERVVDDTRQEQELLSHAVERCAKFKNAALDLPEAKQFVAFLLRHVPRHLKDHQVKAALHLLYAVNAANFSVPGSGKTTVVLAVYERLRTLGEVDALFVVGPPSCFRPWQDEFEATLGRCPDAKVLAGGDIDLRRYLYLTRRDAASELYLTTYQTLQHDWEHVRVLFQRQGIRFFLVVDEGHYIKQVGGAWAQAVLNVAKHAVRRCVLTGTPFPRSYTDSFNLFDVLWPGVSPLFTADRHRIEVLAQRKQFVEAATILKRAIGPLFYRVRKSELNLAPQVYHEPIKVRMNDRERKVYDSILDRIIANSESDFFRDFDVLCKLRRGRMMRLRQCVSYAGLMATAVSEYVENLATDNYALAKIIHHYDKLEVPGKIAVLRSLVRRLRKDGQKVVVWSNFVGTLRLLVRHLEADGYGVGLVYGGTPFERSSVPEEASREEIIREFVRAHSDISVLVANPAACAESVSLHKTCSHAIYYDLSYNCAQYVQSLDRVHRVGGSEEQEAHYYFLEYEGTIDRDILANLRQKAKNMSGVIDEEFPIYSLDMFAEDEELEAYDRLFGRGPRPF